MCVISVQSNVQKNPKPRGQNTPCLHSETNGLVFSREHNSLTINTHHTGWVSVRQCTIIGQACLPSLHNSAVGVHLLDEVVEQSVEHFRLVQVCRMFGPWQLDSLGGGDVGKVVSGGVAEPSVLLTIDDEGWNLQEGQGGQD